VALVAWIIAGILVPVVLFAQTGQEALANLAQQIAEKRSRVEELSSQVDGEKSRFNEELRSLETQIADVEVQISREERRLAQIEQDIEETRQDMQRSQTSIEDIEPMVVGILANMKTYIREGLPFQVPERVAEVDTLERLLSEGNLETQTVLTRVWNMVEGEYRLASESGIYRQTIEVEGEEQLAEVARLGTVLLYFKTFDNRFGYAVPDGAGWRYEVAANREERQKIQTLFDSLRRNLREGFFDVPNPYSEG
jgi:hypothetical protein